MVTSWPSPLENTIGFSVLHRLTLIPRFLPRTGVYPSSITLSLSLDRIGVVHLGAGLATFAISFKDGKSTVDCVESTVGISGAPFSLDSLLPLWETPGVTFTVTGNHGLSLMNCLASLILATAVLRCSHWIDHAVCFLEQSGHLCLVVSFGFGCCLVVCSFVEQ